MRVDLAYLQRRIREETIGDHGVETSIPTDGWPRQRLDKDRFASDLARSRTVAEEPDMPRNSGTRRMASKRELLAAIEKAGGRW